MRTTTTIPVLLVFALMLCGCGKSRQPSKVPETGPGVNVPVETAVVRAVPETYEAVGTVRSKTTSILATRVAGNVVSVNVKPGDAVEAGQTLLEVGAADVVAQVTKATAGLQEALDAVQEAGWAGWAAESAKAAADASKALATTNYKRLKDLLERKSASQMEFDDAEAKYKTALAEADRAEQMSQALKAKHQQALAKVAQAKADIANAEAQLAYTRITSPITGIVTTKNVDAGTFVSAGTELLRIEDNREYRLEVAVAESLVNRIQFGEEAAVTIDALGGKPLPGKVAEVTPASDPRSRSFIVKIDLPANALLRSGMFGRGSFAVGARKAITLPSSAVLERGQLLVVYVVDENSVAHLRLIKTGRALSGRIEILSGLNEGERVVTDKADQVREGARIVR